MKLEYKIDTDGILVKEYLKNIGYSRALLKKIKIDNCIYINGELSKNYYPLEKGDILTIEYQEEMNNEFVSGVNNLDILYEDEYFLIVNKKRGVAVQPSHKHFSDSLFASIKKYYEEMGISSNIHIVTRLDLATSGIVLIAKNGYVHFLCNDLSFTKKYLLMCHNKFDLLEGEFSDPISREDKDTIKRWVDENGKEAHTLYKVLNNTDTPLVEATLLTGRTHQIRVHFAYHNHPLIGDGLYGIDQDNDLMLHCCFLEFIHPITKEQVTINCNPDWL